MNKSIRAIYKNGVLRPLDKLELAEGAEVVLVLESSPTTSVKKEASPDPLAGVGFASGLGDLAQNFDDYRFGRK